MATPKATLHEDGEHFWWSHDCPLEVNPDLDPETMRDCQDLANSPHMLPLGPNGWTVQQRDPLTIFPSILCGRCGVHGWVRDGEWVPA